MRYASPCSRRKCVRTPHWSGFARLGTVLTELSVKRLAGLALPLAIGGSVLAVRAAAAGSVTHAAPGAAACTTTTGGTTTTAGSTTTFPVTLPITQPGGTTTTAASTTTTGGATTTVAATTTTACATTTTSVCPTATTAGGTTSTGATTTTSGGQPTLPITPPGGGGTTTTGSATTTTACTTTTTQGVVITSVASDHIAGHAVTLGGTAPAGSPIVVRGHDPKNGAHNFGGTTTGTDGKWHLRIAHGVLYNTVVQAFSGAHSSNKVSVTVHQVLNLKSDKLLAEKSDGFHYMVAGSSTSHIPNEAITVLIKGHVVGKGRLHSDGTYSVTFLSKTKHFSATVHGTGKSGSGKTYALSGSRSFRI